MNQSGMGIYKIQYLYHTRIFSNMSNLMITKTVKKVAEWQGVKMYGKVKEKLAIIPDLTAQRMETLMGGPTGCGKSHLAEQIAKALGLRFGSLSCSSGMSEGQITGRLIPT